MSPAHAIPWWGIIRFWRCGFKLTLPSDRPSSKKLRKLEFLGWSFARITFQVNRIPTNLLKYRFCTWSFKTMSFRSWPNFLFKHACVPLGVFIAAAGKRNIGCKVDPNKLSPFQAIPWWETIDRISMMAPQKSLQIVSSFSLDGTSFNMIMFNELFLHLHPSEGFAPV